MPSTTMEEIPAQNILKFVQRFEADFAAALQLLKDSGVLRYRAAGNISLRVPGEDRIVIANTGPPQPGVAALVDFDLSRHQGHFGAGLREVAALHIAILQSRPDVNAVIHLHAPYLTGFAVAGRPLPNRYIPLLARSPDDLPVAAWGRDMLRSPYSSCCGNIRGHTVPCWRITGRLPGGRACWK